MPKNKSENIVIPYSYENLQDKDNLINYCKLADFNLSSISHSKIKNYVMHYLYTIEELNPSEKHLFTFLYDFKSQQKYLPWIVITNSKIAYILWISEATISRQLRTLQTYNLIIEDENRFKERVLIVNENIDTWWIAVDEKKISYIEEFRKHLASSNVQLTSEYKLVKNELKWK